MTGELLDPGSLTNQDAALRAAQQFVAAELYQVGPLFDALGNDRLSAATELLEVDQCSGAEIVNYRQLPLVAELYQLCERDIGSRARDFEVAGPDEQEGRGLKADGPV